MGHVGFDQRERVDRPRHRHIEGVDVELEGLEGFVGLVTSPTVLELLNSQVRRRHAIAQFGES